jgi:hypothetical protein
MDLQFILQNMRGNAQRIRLMVEGVAAEQAAWRPDPESWSILEVVNHLADEEVEDFGARLKALLYPQEHKWPAIEPQGWVTQRKYNERDLVESLARFLQAREASLRWLERLDQRVDWGAELAYRGRSLRAGDILVAWPAHDLLHLRQLVELHYAYLRLRGEPYGVDYAGLF